MSAIASAPVVEQGPPIQLLNLVWMAVAFAGLALAIRVNNVWLLNFVHVMCGVLWTGIDLFMGFVIGPILRASPYEARRAIVMRLMPKMIFLMPTLSIVTGTAGYYHAQQIGLLGVGYPQFWWVVAALAIVAILTVQGLLILLPTNLLVYLEMRKARPDGPRIGRLMRRYIFATAFQGVMQVAIIVVMAKFVTGL